MADNQAPLPAGKGIVVRLDRIPDKTREKPGFQGKGTKVVCDIPTQVDDRNYMPFFDRTVWLSMTDRIRSGNGEYKSTDSYRFIEDALRPTVTGNTDEEKAANLKERMAVYDEHFLSQLSPELTAPLLKHYVVYMKEPKPGNNGKVYQDPKRICTLEEVEWELDRRRVPPEESAKLRPESKQETLGLPKPKGTQPDQHPPANPVTPPQEPPKQPASGIGLPTKPGAGLPMAAKPPEPERPAPQKETPKEPPKREPLPEEVLPAADVLAGAKTYFLKGDPYAGIVNWFLGQKGKRKAPELDDPDQRHLLVVLRLTEYALGDGQPANLIAQHLKTRGKMALQELDFKDACALLYSCDLAMSDDTPF